MNEERRRERVEWLLAEFAQLQQGLGEALGPGTLPRPVQPSGEDQKTVTGIVGDLLHALEFEADNGIRMAAVMSVVAIMIDDHGEEQRLQLWQRRGLAVFLAGMTMEVLDKVHREGWR